ncbi:hypothetical protein [Pyrococcus kukulkanii]|uniref:hypothetical protein n=1 Tax=Pyrococcus kukulkanii TaxID=1609559 RepID=UPI003561DC25
MEPIYVRAQTKEKLFVLKKRNGFRDYDEALNFLIEFYETSTRRKLWLRELGFEEV